MKRLILILLPLSLLLGCGEGTALHIAETENSPESYEAFLEEYPDSAQAAELRVKIEGLRYDRAMASRNPETLRDYLARHPDSERIDKARELEDEVSWQTAEGMKTADAYKSYLDLHPEGRWVDKAQVAYAKYEYVAKMIVAEPTIERVNMANDPAGPLNGWGVQAEITNTGDKRLSRVEIAVDYLGASGDVVRSDKWYLVAQSLGAMPVRPYMTPIMEPGETRTFLWSTAEKPAGWDEGKLAVRPTMVRTEEGPAEAAPQ